MPYSNPPTWINGSPPALNSTNLNILSNDLRDHQSRITVLEGSGVGFVSVDTIAALKALTDVANGEVRYVEEYLAGTSRGGGWMKRDTSLASFNEGDTFDHTTEAGGWRRLRHGRPRNLDDFGVNANGVTNDRDAIVRFRNAGGGMVNVGRYQVASRVPGTSGGSIIRGADREKCIFTGSVQFGFINMRTNDTVEDLTLEDTHVDAQCVAYEGGVSNSHVRNCKIRGSGAIGVLAQNGTITDCQITGNDIRCEVGVRLNTASLASRNLLIRGNYIDTLSVGIGINNPGGSGSYDNNAHRVVISENFIRVMGGGDINGFGVALARAAHVVVANNTFYECYQQAIHIEDRSAHIIVSGNVIDQNFASTTSGGIDDGIWVQRSHDISITSNTVRRAKETGINLGSTLESSGLWVNENIVISGNVVTECGGNGIRVHAGARFASAGIMVTNNASNENGGAGLLLEGQGAGAVHCDGNTLRSNTGGGIKVSGSLSAVRIGQNMIYNNAGGPYDVSVLVSAGDPPAIVGHLEGAFQEAVVGAISAFTSWQNMFPLGQWADGWLTVQAARSNSAFRTEVHKITWDGTTLTTSSTPKTMGTGVGATDVEYQAVGGFLRARGMSTTDGDIQVSAVFSGEAWLR